MLALSILSSFAFQASAQTYYDILSSEFNKSADVITFSDVEPLGWPNGRICVEADPINKHNNSLTYVTVSRFVRNNDGYGELLPPRQTIKILHQPVQGFGEVFAPNGEFDNASSTIEVRDLVTRTYDHQGTVITTMTLRKKGDWLLFRRILSSGRDQNRLFGYCYHQSAERLF